jgi:hypothetical protein
MQIIIELGTMRRISWSHCLLNNNTQEPLNPFQLIEEMKQTVGTHLVKSNSSNGESNAGVAEYIFIKDNDWGKSERELHMMNFLDENGIFQINLGAALKDYYIGS